MAGNKCQSSDNDQQEVFDRLETISVGHCVREKNKTEMEYLCNTSVQA